MLRVCHRPPSTPRVRALSPRRRITNMLSLPNPRAYINARSSPHPSLYLSRSLLRTRTSYRAGAASIGDMARGYEEALSCLSSLITRRTRGDGANWGDQFDLMFHYIKILDLEDDISRLKVIHVAGTKGKGSTCTFTESILRSCGFRTGLFTSPHLIDVRERFRLDGLEVSEETFLKNFWWCWNILQEKTSEDLPMPTYFRFLALLAFKIFAAEQVDVAIVEVGLGGRFDATNVVKEPIVCGISSLGYDHMEILGNTLREIAGEKAGIFKKGVPAYTVIQPEEAMVALEDKASQLGVPLHVVSPLEPGLMKNQHLGLDGDHQYINAGLAVALSSVWLERTGNIKDMDIDQNSLPEQFVRGLSRATFEGRAQIVADSLGEQQNSNLGGLTFYLDGAHSPESMETCAKWFSRAIREDGLHLEDQPHEDQNRRRGSNPVSLGGKEHLQILLFNCMSVRDPQRLLPHLVNTCSRHVVPMAFMPEGGGDSHSIVNRCQLITSGVRFHKALFVPNQSVYNKVVSHIPPTDHIQQIDLSWQLKVQRVWENLIQSEQGTRYNSAYGGSLVFPSLPLAIKWLRESVRQSRSAQFQVLVTGSLHLVGDVLRLIKK